MSESNYNTAAQQHLNFYNQLSQKLCPVTPAQPALAGFSMDHKYHPALTDNLRPPGARYLWSQNKP
jgi:hypothetical protein